MTITSETGPRFGTGRVRSALVITSTLFAVGTIALIWFAAVPWGPLVCPAIDPAPRNCFAADRMGTAVITTAVVLVVYISTVVLAACRPRALRPFAVAGLIALLLAPLVSYLAVAWLPGFPLA
ncbi:hypothetical protein LTA6_000020 [Microbacterium sp. LTA6]|uniref:hypothetical protein n=1 Tax=unclassified Microbacterium TaxID=2609290 RepID=UPI003139CBA4